MSLYPSLFISANLLRKNDDQTTVYVQLRWKQELLNKRLHPPYLDLP